VKAVILSKKEGERKNTGLFSFGIVSPGHTGRKRTLYSVYHKKRTRRFHVYPIVFVGYKFFFGNKEYSLNGMKHNDFIVY